MATDVISKIGASNSPTTMDYSTIQAWEDASPADLVAADQRWIGECYNQGTLTGIFTISGETVDSTRYIYLRAATGASFMDNGSVRSNPLIYDNTKGIAIEASTTYSEPWNVQILFTRFTGLQFFNSSPGGGVRGGDIMDSCIVKTASGGSRAIRSINKVVNTLVQIAGGSTGILCTESYGCTVVSSGSGLLFECYGAITLKNCAGFGGGTFASAGAYTGITYCSTDKASLDGAGATGSNNLFSQTFANQFVSTTTDFRSVVTGNLKAGTPDATNTPVDITGLTRNATTPYIGCWEVAGGGPPPATLPPMRSLLGVGK